MCVCIYDDKGQRGGNKAKCAVAITQSVKGRRGIGLDLPLTVRVCLVVRRQQSRATQPPE